jgi:hypothetical protein
LCNLILNFRNGKKVTKIETTITDANGNKTVNITTEEEDIQQNGTKKKLK